MSQIRSQNSAIGNPIDLTIRRTLLVIGFAVSMCCVPMGSTHAAPALASFAWEGAAWLDNAVLEGSFEILVEYDTTNVIPDPNNFPGSPLNWFFVDPSASTVMGNFPPLQAQVPRIQVGQPAPFVVSGNNGGLGLYGINVGEYDLTTSFGPVFAVPDPFGDSWFPTSGGLFSWASGSPVQIEVTVGSDEPGGSPENPILPDLVGPNGEFIFNIDAGDFPVGGNGAWFDPPAATGYRYSIAGGEFVGVAPPDDPSVVDDDDNSYGLHSANGSFLLDPTLGFPASEHDFLANGGAVSDFLIDGISVGGAGLDPADPAAFATFLRVNLTGGDPATITMTPVPEPATITMLLAAMYCGYSRRRRCFALRLARC